MAPSNRGRRGTSGRAAIAARPRPARLPAVVRGIRPRWFAPVPALPWLRPDAAPPTEALPADPTPRGATSIASDPGVAPARSGAANSRASSGDPLDAQALERAVAANRRYGDALGWKAHFDAITGLLGFTTMSPDERPFAQALARWQRGAGLTPDGILGPNTWARVQTQLRPASGGGVDAQLPASGPGFYAYVGPERRWGTRDIVDTLLTIAAAWARAHPNGPRIGIGDISHRGGGPMSGHKSHQKGTDIDIRPMRSDGKDDRVQIQDPRYSRELTRELVGLIRGNGRLGVQFIFFNDTSIDGVKRLAGHDNHLHVRFGAPTGAGELDEAAWEGEWFGESATVPAVKVVTVDPPAARKREANLERGVAVRGTARFTPAGDPRDLVLAATGAAEGEFDTVNMYDKGIVSLGIMQWTLHAGSLQELLAFVKRRLGEMRQIALWPQLFDGLDVQVAGGKRTLLHDGRPVVGIDALRRLFRGSATPDEYVPDTIHRWARLFALAGRHPVVQGLQREFARTQVDVAAAADLANNYVRVKGKWSIKGRDDRYRRVREYLGGHLRLTALYFGMWTNNRVYTYLHLRRAIDAVAARFGSHDLARWTGDWHDALAAEFERVLRASTVGYWGDAKAKRAKRTSRTQKILDAFAAVVKKSP